jgi:hypothetical protein
MKLTDDEKTLHDLIHALLKAYREVMKNPSDMDKVADYGEIYMNVFERITLKDGEKKGRDGK